MKPSLTQMKLVHTVSETQKFFFLKICDLRLTTENGNNLWMCVNSCLQAASSEEGNLPKRAKLDLQPVNVLMMGTGQRQQQLYIVH